MILFFMEYGGNEQTPDGKGLPPSIETHNTLLHRFSVRM